MEPETPSRPLAFAPDELVIRRFQIVRLIGEGGMGEVYEALDRVSGEHIALKTIRPEFAADTATRARFLSELQLARRVAHPNVCRTHELWHEERPGQADLVFLTMELLEGETLAATLKREGHLKPATALPILRQLASALDAIHQLSIIHRDLKPSNVHVIAFDPGGPRVVVTDFGLARLTKGDATLTSGLAGTPAYMAPEQFEHGDCSVASDIYAFGVICYEMLTGQRQPLVPPRTVNPALDPRWEAFILGCVAQDPKKRPPSAQALLAELHQLELPAPRTWQWLPAPSAAVVSVAAIAVLLAAVVWSISAPPVNSAEFTRLTFDSGLSWDLGSSADGSRIVYSSDRGGDQGFQIWTQAMHGSGTIDDPVQLTHESGHAVSPALSPDGKLVAFRSERNGGGVDLVPVAGGPVRRLAPFGRHPRFSPDGARVAYWTGVEGDHALSSGKLWIVDLAGGPPRQLHPSLVDARFPAWSPDGKWILFRGSTTPGLQWDAMSDWFVTDPEGRTLIQTHAFAALAPLHLSLHDSGVAWQPNRITFAARAGHSTNLWSIGISDETGAIVGPPERLTSGSNLETSPWPIADGYLAYTNWAASGQIWRVWTSGDRAGQPERMTQTDALDTRPSVSRDGRRLIFTRRLGEARNLWFKDVVTGKEIALVAGKPLVPTLSPDGQSIAYSVNEGSKQPFWIMPASGGEARRICEDCGEIQSWSADQASLLYVRQGVDGTRTLETLDITSGRRRVLVKGDTLSEGSVSPDDARVAFSVRKGGVESRVYLASIRGTLPIASSAWRPVTPEGEWADKPRWSADGRTLYYYSSRDGFGCLWRQSIIDGVPGGAPEAVHHLHDARYAILHFSRQAFSISVGPDFLVYNAPNAGGNIWIMSPAPPAPGLTRLLEWIRMRVS